jgi:hypothetical protein
VCPCDIAGCKIFPGLAFEVQEPVCFPVEETPNRTRNVRAVSHTHSPITTQPRPLIYIHIYAACYFSNLAFTEFERRFSYDVRRLHTGAAGGRAGGRAGGGIGGGIGGSMDYYAILGTNRDANLHDVQKA